LFLLVLISSSFFSTIGVDPHHDGIMLKPALDVSRGLVLFKNTFTEYGGLSTYIQALALKIFGEYLLTLKILTAIFYALISVLLYYISIKFLPKFLAFISIILYFAIAPYYSFTFLIWSSVYALFFQLWGTLVLINAISKKSSTKFLYVGILTALAFWCRQTVGVTMFFAVIGYFMYLIVFKKNKFKKIQLYLFKYILGTLTICFLFLIYLFSTSSFTDWWKQTIIYNYEWGKTYTGNYNVFRLIFFLFDTVDPKGLINFWTLIPVTTLLFFIKNWRHKNLTALTLIGLASWTQYFPLNDSVHLFWAAMPMLPLFALFIFQLFKDFLLNKNQFTKHLSKYATALLMVIIFIPNLNYSLKAARQKITNHYVYLQQPTILRGLRIGDSDAQFYTNLYQKIEKYFSNNPNGNVIDNGPDPLYLTFDPRIKNIYPMFFNWFSIKQSVYPNYDQQVNQYIKNNQPLIVSEIQDIPQNYCQIKYLNPTNYKTAILSQYCQ
jgi:4-amino-4-deoxy-L-arabinose transferase-like glycosyltransferase